MIHMNECQSCGKVFPATLATIYCLRCTEARGEVYGRVHYAKVV